MATTQVRGSASSVSAPVLGALLALLTVLVFAPSLGSDFVNFDDPMYVTENPRTLEGLTLHGIAWELGHLAVCNWHPLTMISHRLDVELFGLNPAGHHATSLFLHVLNAVLLFAILRHLTGAAWPSALTAALFAVHPTHVESVAWVAGRKDLLCLLFWLMTMAAYARWTRRRSRGGYALVFLCLLLSLMSKSMAITLPVVLLLLDLWPLGRVTGAGWRRQLPGLVVEKLPLFALCLVVTAATVVAQGEAIRSVDSVPTPRLLQGTLINYVTYLGRTIWPAGLTVFYPQPAQLAGWQWSGAFLLLLAVTVAALRAGRAHPGLLVGWLWYLFTLFPVAGIVQIGEHATADRYTYIPTIGIFAALAWGLAGAAARWRISGFAASLGLVTVLALAVRSRAQVRVWHDTRTLFESAIAVAPTEVALTNLASYESSLGETQRAIDRFHRALDLDPESYLAQAGLGDALRAAGRLEESLTWLERARARRRGDARIPYSLALTLSALGRDPEAIENLRSALEVDPSLAPAHHGLAVLLEQRGHAEEALTHYLLALRSDPRRVELHAVVGTLLAERGRYAEARDHLLAALRAAPDDAATHANLALVLERLGDARGAVAHLEAALARDPSLAAQGFADQLADLRRRALPAPGQAP